VAPLAGRQLGALGADVIKIEPPRGDVNRVNGPLRADGESHVFALSNTDKRGLVLDLRRDADKKVLWDVLASADVVIENLKPGSLGRLGFGRDEVRGKHPQLIYCSVNGFGHDSAYPGRPALDTVVQAMSGLMSTTMVDGVPTKAGISVSDQIGGLFGLLGVLAALQRREQFDGSGSTLDLAMHDGSAWMTHPLWNGVGAVSARILQVADGFVAVDGDDDTVSAAIDPAKTRAMTRDELVDRLASVRGCAVAPVLTVDEVLAHPQTAARGLLLEVPTSDGDRWTVLGSPLRLLSTPALVSTAMPRLGVLDPDLANEFGPSAPAHHGGSASPQDALAGTGV